MTDGSIDETLETLGGARRPLLLERLVPAPHLVLALECDRPMAGPARHVLTGVDEVLLGRGAARTVVREPGHLVVSVPDARLSSRHARLVRRDGGWSVEDLDSRNGVHRHGVRVARAELVDGDLLTLGHTLFLFRAALPTHAAHPADLDAAALESPAVGLDTLLPALANDFTALAQMAVASLPLLLEGETGTGKEVLARAVHQLTGRRGDLVAINCGALPPTLVESELFGHVRGAFSGAVAERAGLIRAADRGTLFLDEVGELPLPAQVALLRVLQEREVVPVGGQRPIPVDFALVAATNRPLERSIAGGQFRADLFARLAGFRLRLPPLRERREDLALLMRALLALHGRADARFTPAAALALFAHPWPLNVRELQHALVGALARARDGHIDLVHLPSELWQPRAATSATPADSEELRARLTTLMTEHSGNIAEVARVLGKGRTQIHRWLERYGLDPERFRR
jgi:DNA-binding NtrC family response regulator